MGATELSGLGISINDFELESFLDLGQSVVRTPRVKTISNVTGSPTYTSGTNETISAIFRRRSRTYDWAKEGLFESGDFFMQVKTTQALNKEDIITVGTEKFRVDNVIMRQIGGVDIFKVANGFLID